MINFVRKFLGLPSYQVLNKIEVSQANLIKNYRYLSKLNKKVKIAPVLKSNAYGHGIGLVAKILDPLKVPFFCVDSLFEAYEILKTKVKTPILIMGHIDPQNLSVKKLPFTYAIYDLITAKAVARYQPHAQVHIFVDTGMHREGILVSNLKDFLAEIRNLNLNIAGLMSHLAVGGIPKHPLTKKQVNEFNKAINICQKDGLKLRFLHLGGSNAILHTKPTGCNINRVGLGIYGIDPAGEDQDLNPILTLKTKVVSIKQIKKGESTGYNAAFTAKRDMTIGTLPIGYYDGVDRGLSNKGIVTLDGKICPIIGFTSMNITTIDLSKVNDPTVGQEIVVFSNDPRAPNSVQNAARICQTTPYVILIHLAASTKRVIV